MGEAIADQEVFLLAWSKNSAASHFVEFEWCTAIALKKTIVPCLLDETPLAVSLRAFHGYSVQDVAGLTTCLSAAPPADQSRRTPVLDKLHDITALEETAVLAQAKAVFAQQQWAVQGNLYQAGGDIHIHNAPSTATTPEKAKPLVERWQAWVVIIGGILAAIIAVLQIKDRIWPPEILGQRSHPSIEDRSAQFVEQLIAGTVFGEGDERLPGVLIKLPEFNTNVLSDENGRYRFSVKARRGQQVELLAQTNALRFHGAICQLRERA